MKYNGIRINWNSQDYIPLKNLAKFLSLDYAWLRNLCRQYHYLESQKITVKGLSRRDEATTLIVIPDYALDDLLQLLKNPKRPPEGLQVL